MNPSIKIGTIRVLGGRLYVRTQTPQSDQDKGVYWWKSISEPYTVLHLHWGFLRNPTRAELEFAQ